MNSGPYFEKGVQTIFEKRMVAHFFGEVSDAAILRGLFERFVELRTDEAILRTMNSPEDYQAMQDKAAENIRTIVWYYEGNI
jgi:hypothetical protein